MENLLEAIRASIASDATDEARAVGAQACRTILVALEAKPGESLAVPSPIPTEHGGSQLAALIAGLRGIPADQLLDLAIAKLRTMVPADGAAPPTRRLAIPLVPVPRRP